MTEDSFCKVFDFVSIKATIEERNKVIYCEVSEEEWEDCVHILFSFMVENGYDPHKQAEIIQFVKDYFPNLPNNDNEDQEDE